MRKVKRVVFFVLVFILLSGSLDSLLNVVNHDLTFTNKINAAKKPKIKIKRYKNGKIYSYQKITYHYNNTIKTKAITKYNKKSQKTSYDKDTYNTNKKKIRRDTKSWYINGKLKQKTKATDYWTYSKKRSYMDYLKLTYNNKGQKTKKYIIRRGKNLKNKDYVAYTYKNKKAIYKYKKFYTNKGELKNYYKYHKVNNKWKKYKLYSYYYGKLVTFQEEEEVTAKMIRNKIYKEAVKHKSKPYSSGNGSGGGPKKFDCSGLTKYVYKKAMNIDLIYSAKE